jgi:hypothetical protein
LNVSYEEALRRGWITRDAMPAPAPKASRTGGKAAGAGNVRNVRQAPRTNKREAEGEEQAQLIELFRARFPDVGELLIHIPNGGYRKNKFEGWRLKQQGVRAGVSDLNLPVARSGFFGLWIEFKAAPPNDAPPTEAQLDWLERMRAEGYRAELCLGVEAALAVLTDYLSGAPTIAFCA